MRTTDSGSLVLVFLLAACGGGDLVSPPATPPPPPPPPAPVASITLSATADTLDVQQTVQLTATPRDAAGNVLTGPTVSWSSSTPGVATVSTSGLVTGVTPGAALVEAASGGVKAQATITVVPAAGAATTLLAGTITLPAGAIISPAALQIGNGLGKAAVAGTGAFALRSLSGGPQMAAVYASGDRPILFAWLDQQHTSVTARSTAEVLAYFDLGGHLLPKSGRAFLLQELARRSELANLENAIKAALAAASATVSLDVAGVHQARRALQASLLPSSRAALRGGSPQNIVRIDPTATKSGILVYEPELHSIRIRNDWRRRAVALLDLVSYVGQDGQTRPLSYRIKTEIPPTYGIVSIGQSLENWVKGDLPWVPLESEVLPTPLTPVNALATKYRLLVLGAGKLSASDLAFLTPDEMRELVQVTGKALFADIVLPMLQNFILEGDVAGDAIDQALKSPAAANELSDAIGILFDESEEIFQAAWSGDFRGAVAGVMTALLGGDAFQQAAFNVAALVAARLFPDPYESVTILAAAKEYGEKVMRFIGKIDLALTIADACVQGWYAGQSNAVEVWDLQVDASKISLTPAASRIGTGDTLRLTAKVLGVETLPAGAILTYKWTVTGGRGTLSAGSQSGAQFTSSINSVKYQSDGVSEGEDQVTVVVSRVQAGTPTVTIGSATATIDVREAAISLVPEKISLSDGESYRFTVKVPDELKAGVTLHYRWSTSGRFGWFGGGAGARSYEGPSDQVFYFAHSQTDGADDIVVEVLATTIPPPGGIGYTVSLGVDRALVKVERRKTIILGTWDIETTPLDAGRVCKVVYVKVPRVSDAESYQVHAYGFTWPTGAEEINFTALQNDVEFLPCVSGGGWGRSGWNGNQYWYHWSAGAGPAASADANEAVTRARLASMIVEVTVRYP